MTQTKLAVIQMNSRHDKKENMQMLDRLIRDLCAREKPDYVLTPEYATFLGGKVAEQHAAAETIESGETVKRLSDLARELQVTLHLGSLLERDGEAVYNSSLVFSKEGALVGKYRKIHRFDVETPSGVVFRESDVVGAGENPVIVEAGGLRVGASICYDVRFSELYLNYAKSGVDMITIPAAFNYETGAAHWETLVRARAIEAQSYVAAAGQIGHHLQPGGEQPCFGNSMIVDPWGKVIARCTDTTGWACAMIDAHYIAAIRARIPMANHRRL